VNIIYVNRTFVIENYRNKEYYTVQCTLLVDFYVVQNIVIKKSYNLIE